MNTKELKKFKQEAWTAGENDTITEDHLIQGAQLFISNEIRGEMTDEQHNDIIEAYRYGFMGKNMDKCKICGEDLYGLVLVHHHN